VALAPWIGINGVALALAVINVLYWLALTLYCQPMIGNTFAGIFGALIGPIIAAAVAGAALFAALMHRTDVPWLISCGAIAGLIYVVALFVFDWKRVMLDLSVVKKMLSKRRPVEELG
jgi:hypothetical protein